MMNKTFSQEKRMFFKDSDHFFYLQKEQVLWSVLQKAFRKGNVSVPDA